MLSDGRAITDFFLQPGNCIFSHSQFICQVFDFRDPADLAGRLRECGRSRDLCDAQYVQIWQKVGRLFKIIVLSV